MSLYSSPPRARPFSEEKPTLLVCWWIAAFCTTIILLRVAGRLIRVGKLFREDKVAAAAIIPLFLRTAFVHVVLLYGTNNVDLVGLDLSEEDIHHRSLASGLVLASRVAFAATLWTSKAATLEFFRRLIGSAREKSSARVMLLMRSTLLATFLVVIISNLAECQPFNHYWQVIPDPGGQCRQGYASLVTTAVCNVLTDLLLAVYPIPVVMASRIPKTRKVILISLFCLGLFTVMISIYRVPQVLAEHGYQTTRSMWASIELLIATVAANILALASFVRGLGVKKAKFKYDPYDPTSSKRSKHRMGTIYDTWKDHDLDTQIVALGNATNCESKAGARTADGVQSSKYSRDGDASPTQSVDSLIPRGHPPLATSKVTKTTEIQVTVTDIGDFNKHSFGTGTHVVSAQHVGVTHSEPSRSLLAGTRGQTRGSTLLLQDIDKLPNQLGKVDDNTAPSV